MKGWPASGHGPCQRHRHAGRRGHAQAAPYPLIRQAFNAEQITAARLLLIHSATEVSAALMMKYPQIVQDAVKARLYKLKA
jgi:hypothetical protein